MYQHLGCRVYGKKDSIAKHELENGPKHLFLAQTIVQSQSNMIGHMMNEACLLRSVFHIQDFMGFEPQSVPVKPGLVLTLNLPVDIWDEKSGLWGNGFVKSLDAPSRASIQLTSDFSLIVLVFPADRNRIEHFNSKKIVTLAADLQTPFENLWGFSTRFFPSDGNHWSLESAHQMFRTGSLLEVKIGGEAWMLMYLFELTENQKMILRPVVRGAYRPFLNATITPTKSMCHSVNDVQVTPANADMFEFCVANTHVPLPFQFNRTMFASSTRNSKEILVKLEHSNRNGKGVNLVEIPTMQAKYSLLSDLKPVSSTTPVPKDWQALVSAATQYQPCLGSEMKTEKKVLNKESKKRKTPPEKEEDEEEETQEILVVEEKEKKEEKESKPIKVFRPRPPSAYRLFLIDQRTKVGNRPTIKAVAAAWKLLTSDDKRPYVVRNHNLLKEWRSKNP